MVKGKYTVNQFSGLQRPSVNLAKRVEQLAKQGDGFHTLQVVIIKGEWRLSVNGKPLEYLGQVNE